MSGSRRSSSAIDVAGVIVKPVMDHQLLEAAGHVKASFRIVGPNYKIKPNCFYKDNFELFTQFIGSPNLSIIELIALGNTCSRFDIMFINNSCSEKKLTSVPVTRKGMSEYVDVSNSRLCDRTGVVGLSCWRGLAPIVSNMPLGTAVKVTNVTVGEFEGQKTVSTSANSDILVLPINTFADVPVEDVVPANIGTRITIDGLATLSRYPRCTGATAGCKKKMVVTTGGDLFCESCTRSCLTEDAALGMGATVTVILVGGEEKIASVFNESIGELLAHLDYDTMLFKDWDADQLFDLVCGELPLEARVNLTNRNGLVINEVYSVNR